MFAGREGLYYSIMRHPVSYSIASIPDPWWEPVLVPELNTTSSTSSR